ncbi:MAG: hypothetical protein WC438_03900 [Candidatus Pacearchaeota archaeon]
MTKLENIPDYTYLRKAECRDNNKHLGEQRTLLFGAIVQRDGRNVIEMQCSNCGQNYYRAPTRREYAREFWYNLKEMFQRF